jgi:hypothetical protein
MTDQDSSLVWGAAAIGEVIGKDERATYYLLENGLIPATKAGSQWVSERDKLRDPTSWPRRKTGEAS